MEKLHQNHNVFQCLQCQALFPTKSLLTTHNLTHGDGAGGSGISAESLDCPSVFCNLNFPVTSALARHVTREHTLPQNFVNLNCGDTIKPAGHSYQCNDCKKVFSRSDWYEEHLLSHMKESEWPYQCRTCFKRYSRPAALASHMKTHKPEHYFRCSICGKNFGTLLESKKHAVAHRDPTDGKFHCSQCSNVYDTFQAIRAHCRYKHSSQNYACHLCSKTFPRSDKLRLHMLSHSSAKQFLCSLCGKQFKRKDKLREHQNRLHNSSRIQDLPVQTQEDQLRQRRDMTDLAWDLDLSVQPNAEDEAEGFIFKCELCVKGFRRRGMLMNHFRTTHPDVDLANIPELNLPLLRTEKAYDCHHCRKTYKSTAKRKAHHLKSHPGLPLPLGAVEADAEGQECGRKVKQVVHLPFQCPQCPKEYANRSALVVHTKKAHAQLPSTSKNPSGAHLIPTTQTVTLPASETSEVRASLTMMPLAGLPALKRRPEFSSTTGNSDRSNISPARSNPETQESYPGTPRVSVSYQTPGRENIDRSPLVRDSEVMVNAWPDGRPETGFSFSSSSPTGGRVRESQGEFLIGGNSGGLVRPPPLIPISSMGTPSGLLHLQNNTPMRDCVSEAPSTLETPVRRGSPSEGFTPQFHFQDSEDGHILSPTWNATPVTLTSFHHS